MTPLRLAAACLFLCACVAQPAEPGPGDDPSPSGPTGRADCGGCVEEPAPPAFSARCVATLERILSVTATEHDRSIIDRAAVGNLGPAQRRAAEAFYNVHGVADTAAVSVETWTLGTAGSRIEVKVMEGEARLSVVLDENGAIVVHGGTDGFRCAEVDDEPVDPPAAECLAAYLDSAPHNDRYLRRQRGITTLDEGADGRFTQTDEGLPTTELTAAFRTFRREEAFDGMTAIEFEVDDWLAIVADKGARITLRPVTVEQTEPPRGVTYVMGGSHDDLRYLVRDDGRAPRFVCEPLETARAE